MAGWALELLMMMMIGADWRSIDADISTHGDG